MKLEEYVGKFVFVEIAEDDDFLYEFCGKVIGISNNLLLVKDLDGDVSEVAISKVTVDLNK